MTTSKTSASYLPHVDGLRALAVLVILLFHLDVPFIPGGFVGVDVFFVISGFLITQLIYRDMSAGKFSFVDFYARRIKRIFPALFTMLFVSAAVAVFFLGPRDYADFFQAFRAACGQIANIFFNKEVDYFAVGHAHSPLLHTWSLGVEEQFYVVWPVLLLLVFKWGGRKWASPVLATLLVSSLAISEYLVRTDAMGAFYLLHSRAWELALGGLVGLWVLKPLRDPKMAEAVGIFGLLLIAIAVFEFTSEGFPGLKAVVPCLGAAMFIYAAQGTGGVTWVQRVFSVKPLVFVGIISYSLYLWHWPIIGFYKSYFGPELDVREQVCMGLAAFGLAYASFRLVEQPLRHSRLSGRKTIVIGLGVMLSFILVSNIVKRWDDAPWRVTYKLDEAVLRPNSYFKLCAADGAAWDNMDDCIIGPNKDAYEVILTGDSHAGHYMPNVLAWAKENNLTVRLFLRGACESFMVPGTTVMRHGKVDENCMRLQKDFHDLVRDDSSHIQYVFLSLRQASGEGDDKAAFERIASYGRKVAFLGSVPEFDEHPHDCQMRNNLLASQYFPRKQQNCLGFEAAYTEPLIEKGNRTLRPLLAQLGILHFDPIPYVKSPYDKDGNFMYLDGNHLNKYGAAHLQPYLDSFLKQQRFLDK